tara:strand:+ start:24329 stop:24793 length:465 start_codon:yes stop_codon:yes gene_type:complete
MRNLTTITTIAAACTVAITFFAACNPKSTVELGLDDLSARFVAANQADTIAPMLKLYCLDGSDALITSRLKGALDYELGLPIQQIDFAALSGAPEETIEFTHNGISYGPSLTPRYRMRVLYAVEDHFSSLFTVGQNPSGEWQIICAKPKPPIRY